MRSGLRKRAVLRRVHCHLREQTHEPILVARCVFLPVAGFRIARRRRVTLRSFGCGRRGIPATRGSLFRPVLFPDQSDHRHHRRHPSLRRQARGLLARGRRCADQGAAGLAIASRGGESRRPERIRPWRSRPGAKQYPQHAAHAADDPSVGKESGHVFQRHDHQRLHLDGTQLCAAGNAPARSDRAREADAGRAAGGAREPEESADDLHPDRAGAIARPDRVLPERCAGGIRRRERRRAEKGIRRIQRRGDQGAGRLSDMAEERGAAASRTATSASAPTPSARNSNTTRWSTCRWTSWSPSTWPTCTEPGRVRRGREGTRSRQDSAPGAGRAGRRPSGSRTSCSTPSAPPSTR